MGLLRAFQSRISFDYRFTTGVSPKASQVKPHNSSGLITFSVIVSNFVNLLNECNQVGDLELSSPLYKARERLIQFLKEKWWFYVNDKY